MRFIRKNGRVIPISDKERMKSARDKTKAVALVGAGGALGAAAFGVHGIYKSEQAAAKIRAAKAFANTGAGAVAEKFLHEAKKDILSNMKSHSAAKRGLGLFGVGVAGLATLGYLRRPSTRKK